MKPPRSSAGVPPADCGATRLRFGPETIYRQAGPSRLWACAEAFWRREHYDALIRSEGEFERSLRYVAASREKAKLRKWMWVCGQDARTTAYGGATKKPAA